MYSDQSLYKSIFANTHLDHTREVRGTEEACRAQGISFLPMVVESLGAWGDVVAIQVVQWLSAALSRRTGRQEEEVHCHT